MPQSLDATPLTLSEYLDSDREMLLEQDMADALQAEDGDTQQAPQPPRFTVTDLDSAAWAVRKIAEARAKQAEIDAYADAEIERINKWRQAAKAPAERKIGYLTSLLGAYHAQELARDPSRKTIKLPHGELQIRAQQPEWQYSDEATEWLRLHRPEWVRVRYEPDKMAIKKGVVVRDGRAVDENGEPIPGITVVERPPAFKVVTPEKAS